MYKRNSCLGIFDKTNRKVSLSGQMYVFTSQTKQRLIKEISFKLMKKNFIKMYKGKSVHQNISQSENYIRFFILLFMHAILVWLLLIFSLQLNTRKLMEYFFVSFICILFHTASFTLNAHGELTQTVERRETVKSLVRDIHFLPYLVI